ncbi:MAG: BON domain-containing protein [Desulfonatronovibrio sp.]
MLNFNRIMGFGFVLVMLFSLLACQTPAGRSAGETVDDSTISAKVKAALYDDEMVSGFAISVDTFQGEVTLNGAVDNEGQRERAGEIARSVTGVRAVNNLLNIKEN